MRAPSPGVLSVSAISHLPIGGGGAGRAFLIDGRPDPGPEHRSGGGYSLACPNYFRTMGIPLIAGREFTHQDTVNAPGVIVINQTMANRYWPKEDPLGRRIRFTESGPDQPWLTVVGVTRDVRHDGLDQPPYPEFSRPYTQAAWPFMTVVVKTASAPGAFSRPVQNALLKIDPTRPRREWPRWRKCCTIHSARAVSHLAVGCFRPPGLDARRSRDLRSGELLGGAAYA